MIINNIFKSVALLICSIFLCSCHGNKEEKQEASFYIKGDTVYINKDSLLSSNLKIVNASKKPYSKEVVTSGRVEPIPNKFAYVGSPFSGRVIKSYIKLGQKVTVNTPIFEVVSPEFTSSQKDYFSAKTQRDLAKKDLERKQDLFKHGVASQKEVEEASSTLAISEQDVQNALTSLKVYQTNPSNMVLGQSLIIRSPISGIIIENNIVTGQYISSDSEPIAKIADLSKVWITAQVKEKDIRFINEGDDMDINIAAFPNEKIKGTVFHLKESVDEDTRSINVLSICDNQKGLLKIGMYTTVHFIDKPIDAIYIPEKAILQGEDGPYVFVEVDKNVFVKKNISVEASKSGESIVLEGLSGDEKIIGEGGYYLK